MVKQKVLWLDAVTSTNDAAWSLLEKNTHRAVAAHHQTAGRGRAGRTWSSPIHAGLYLSWICHPSIAPEQGSVVPLAIAVAAAEVCDELGCPVRLKWPNDLLYNGKKIAGILCEARQTGSQWTVVVGIGINLSSPKEGWTELPGAISLAEAGCPDVDKMRLADALVSAFEKWITRLELNGLSHVLDAWEARGPRLGAKLAHAGRTGHFEGLAQHGGLKLKIGDRIEVIHGGDVHLIEGGDYEQC